MPQVHQAALQPRPQGTWRSRVVVPRSIRGAEGCPQSAMQWGARGARRRSHGGYGRPVIITVGPFWRLSVGDGRMRCCSHGKSAERLS